MLLAIDIGNTNISCGIFTGKRLTRIFGISTEGYSIQRLKRSLGSADIDDSIICSVVPKTTGVLKGDLNKLMNKKPLILDKEVKVPIKNIYRKPKQVGQDRLTNAYAAAIIYGYPAIVVDFGTAVTFDAISKKKEYLGGLILPGLEISLAVLAQKTALLPRIRLEKPKEFIGRDTRSSMLSGIVYGFACLVDDLTKRIKVKIGRKAKVIGTGGNIDLIKGYCQRIDKIDGDLTLKGLNLIYMGQCSEIK